MEPKLIIKSTAIDLELSELLGGETADFIVICANGEQVPFLGTPYDTPSKRDAYTGVIAWLNDRRRNDWPEMFNNWKSHFCAHYKLPAETTAQDFWPEFSFAISRVCPGYSESLHVAIMLLEQLGKRVDGWTATSSGSHNEVEIRAASGACYRVREETLAQAIAKAVRALLTAPASPEK